MKQRTVAGGEGGSSIIWVPKGGAASTKLRSHNDQQARPEATRTGRPSRRSRSNHSSGFVAVTKSICQSTSQLAPSSCPRLLCRLHRHSRPSKCPRPKSLSEFLCPASQSICYLSGLTCLRRWTGTQGSPCRGLRGCVDRPTLLHNSHQHAHHSISIQLRSASHCMDS